MRFKSVAEFLNQENGYGPTDAEHSLIAACRAGENCILGDGKRPDTQSTDRLIRAELLALLITGGTEHCGLHPKGVWLEGAWITGTLDLQFMKAIGQTMLVRCHFTFTPNLTHSHLNVLSFGGSHLPGLIAPYCEIDGGLFLDGLVATDTVHLAGAKIGGQLDCTEAKFDVAKGYALHAEGVTIMQDVLLTKLTATGTVTVIGAKIGGQLVCEGATLDGAGRDALHADSLRVNAGFFFQKLSSVTGRIDLTGAHVGDLVDDVVSWPTKPGDLGINGFTYDRLGSTAPKTLADRECWLLCGSNTDTQFHPQPYTQLAKVLRSMGYSGEARLVLAEQARLLGKEARRLGRLNPDGTHLLDFESPSANAKHVFHVVVDTIARLVVGYGHQPWRSAGWLAFLFLIAATLAGLTWQEGSFAPNSAVILTSPAWLQAEAVDCIPAPAPGCDRNPAQTWSNDPAGGLDWDSFSSVGYAADLVIPILDLGQTDAWAPSKDRGTMGKFLWWGRWVLAALGWIASGLGIAAITGIMQRNAPGA